MPVLDLLTDIFKSVRLEGSIFFNSKLSAPWDLQLDASSCPRFHLVVEGGTWLESSALITPASLSAGEAVFLNDGGPHRLGNSLMGSSPCTNSHARCHLICGTFGFDQALKHPLIDTLPAHIRLSIPDEEHTFWAIVRVMVGELGEPQLGTNAAVDRLCELFLIQVLRSYAKNNPMLPGFVAALDDPIIRSSLQLIHDQPERDWTIGSLAHAVGLSRSAFAKRFHQLVGVPPKTYLLTWRMHKAERLLRNPYIRLATVALQVGYASDAAFNRAFKRFFGKSPGAFQAEIRRNSRP